jgi:hypothetical protein
MSKATFIQTVESLFATNAVSPEVKLYFETTVKAKKINKKEIEKANIVKSAILEFLTANAGTAFDRTEIGDTLHDSGNYDENTFMNDKGTGVAYNSITAFANQLVASGDIVKFEVKVGKSKKVKYQVQ